MKTLRPATLGLVAVAALALAGNAFATQQIAVSQASSSLTIKASQAQSDAQPAKITFYVPAGYTLNATQTAGTKIGTTTGHVFARDLNLTLPLEGDVVVDDPAKHTTDSCSPGSHTAVWILQLTIQGNTIALPVYVSPTSGAETSRGSAKLEVCLSPDDTPAGSPGRSPNGAHLIDATFTVNGVITPPVGAERWISLWTPYATGTGLPNAAGTVEARSFVGPGATTIASKVLNRKKKLLRISGKVTQSGIAVAGAKVTLQINNRNRFTARTQANGSYFFKLQSKARRKVTSFFRTKTTVAAREAGAAGCASPTVTGVPCVSATAGGFTATSKKIKVRL
jgi:hypothetical protein